MLYSLTLSTGKFPAFTAPVPSLPGQKGKLPEENQPNVFEFTDKVSYLVDEETLSALLNYISQQENYIQREIKPVYTAVEVTKIKPSSIESLKKRKSRPVVQEPVEATVLETEIVELAESVESVESVEEFTLSIEDEDLIAVEIAKIKDLKISEAEDLIENVAANHDFPLALRLLYLENIVQGVESEELKKGLKPFAEKIISQLKPSVEPEADSGD